MATFVDFEELINLDEIHLQTENEGSLFSSQEPLSAVLDKIYEKLDVNELEMSFENIAKVTKDLDDEKFAELEFTNADCVLKNDVTNIEKKNSVIVEDEKNCKSVTPNSCIRTDFDTVQDVGNVNTEEKNTTECTEVKITSPTTKGLAEFNQIYKATCFTNNKLQRLEENENVERQEQDDNLIINLDEFEMVYNCSEFKEAATDVIKLDETKDNEQNDFNDAINGENLHEITNNTDEPHATENNNNNLEHKYAVTTTIEIEVGKEDLRKIEPSNVLKTVVIDISDDDVISISSSESEDGYNSSDFEFITEDEAKKVGISTKLDKKSASAIPETSNNKRNRAIDYDSLPDHIKYHRNRYLRHRVQFNRGAHVIPDRECLSNLFRLLPIMNGVYYSTNKHILPSKGIPSTTDGFGFLFPDNIEENSEFKEEADETTKKIRFLYPSENRKRRRF